MKSYVRYKKICDWLSNRIVTENQLLNEEFTLAEIQFIADFDKRTLFKEQPELIQHFRGVL